MWYYSIGFHGRMPGVETPTSAPDDRAEATSARLVGARRAGSVRVGRGPLSNWSSIRGGRAVAEAKAASRSYGHGRRATALPARFWHDPTGEG